MDSLEGLNALSRIGGTNWWSKSKLTKLNTKLIFNIFFFMSGSGKNLLHF
jgi:hypothetical protein